MIKRFLKILALFEGFIGRAGIAKMFGSSLVLSMLEFVGVALIFPFVRLVTDVEYSQRVVVILNSIWTQDVFWDQRNTVLSCGVALLMFYLAKGLLQARLIEYQARVSALINSRASQDLISRTLQARYKLFQYHSPVKIAGISYSNTSHASLLIQSMVTACNEMILVGFLIAALIISSVSFSLFIIGVLFILALFVFMPLSRRVAKIGRLSQQIDLARHRFVYTMISAIRDIKIMGLESIFIKRNKNIAEEHASLISSYTAVSAVQRLTVEIVMLCATVLGCIWIVLSDQDVVHLAPMIATAGLAAVRAAPAVSRLAGAYNGFRYSLPFVEGLIEMREEINQYPQLRSDDQVRFDGSYQVRNVSFRYQDEFILKDVCMEIPKGKVVAIVGHSGSGKSTLLDLLAGLQLPETGTFNLGGKPFQPFYSAAFSRRVGYVSQSIALLDASLEYNIALEESPDSEKLLKAVQKASLSQFVESLSEGMKTRLGEGGQGVSGGQRQRIGIARALYREPALLILDEVTSALDPVTEAEVMGELLQLRGNTTLLIVTHKKSTVSTADKIYQLKNGFLTLSEDIST